LPVTDPDRRRDLFGTQAGIGKVLLYVRAGGGAVRCRGSHGTSGYEHRDQVEHGALVSRQGPVGPRGPAGDSGQCSRVLVVDAVEGRYDRHAELGHLGQRCAVYLDDEFLKAAAEPSREGLVRLGDEHVSRAQCVCPVRALEPGVAAQRQVDSDRVGGAALDDFPGAANHMGGPADPGKIEVGKSHVQFCGDEWPTCLYVKPDERGRVVRLP
jgi:hypothetical protein